MAVGRWFERASRIALALALVLVVGCSSAESPPTATLRSDGPPAAATGPAAATRAPAPTSAPLPTLAPTPTRAPRPTIAPTPTIDPIDKLLAELADSPDGWVRQEAAERLAGVQDPRVGPALEAALRDEDAGVRAAAATALGARGETHAVKALATALRAETTGELDTDVLVAASTALGKLGGSGGVTALISVLQSGDKAGRSAALKALAAIGKDALAGLKKALASKDADLRVAAVDGLGALGKLGVKPLIGALKDTDVNVRTAAANRLGRLGDRSAVKPLLAVLDNREWRTVSIAIVRLYRDEPAKLLPYLRSKATLPVYYGMILLGADETVDGLVLALGRLGEVEMAEDYLNCGNDELEEAARDWAAAHGYAVVTVPGSGGGTWGSGLPE